MATPTIFDSTDGSTVVEVVDEPLGSPRAFFEHHRYADLGPISRGAFGDVRRVHDTQSSSVMAMKVSRRCLTPESRAYARFATEIEIMGSLRHPGILGLHDDGDFDDGRLWFTMPEIQGRTFAVVLDELHALDLSEVNRSALFRQALELLAQCCDIVAFAHEQRIIHRDLKPKNLLIADDGPLFVIDWGIARHQVADTHWVLTRGNFKVQRIRTEPGEVLGTPAYMPPEQAFGDISLQSLASDVYSIGAVLYHLLTGRPPYQGKRPAVIAQIKRGPPPPLSAVVRANRVLPRKLVALCDAAMERQPAKRIAGAFRIGQGIREWLEHPSFADS